jgi:type IV pilus assembly protein PilE
MAAVIIIGILLKIAVPAYTASIQRSYRTDAKTALLDLATREEKFYSINNQYTNSASSLNYGATATFPLNVQSGSTAYYQLNVATPTAGTATTVAAFSATAVPIAGTTQATDACGTFTINSAGVTGNETSGGTAITITCW